MPDKDTTNKAPAYQWYPDKAALDTRRLSWAAKGVYRELLDVIWMQCQDTCSIPDDDEYIASELGCVLNTWIGARAEIMCEHRPLLVLTETNRLFSKGLWKERCKQVQRREQLAANGRKGGRPKKTNVKQKVPVEKPNDNQKQSLLSSFPSPTTPTEETHTEREREETPGLFMDNHPEYKDLMESDEMATITPEHYQTILRLHPRADPEAAVARACVEASMRTKGLDEPALFLRAKFRQIEEESTDGIGISSIK